MGKSTHFSGQPLYCQVIKLLDKSTILRLSREYGGEHYVKRFDIWTHLVVMLYAVIMRFDSLREIMASLQAESRKLCHLGIRLMPSRSTLSDANRRRPEIIFESIYRDLYTTYRNKLSSDSRKNKDKAWMKRLQIIDSTTITLFSNLLFKGVGRHPKTGKKKGGIKVHTIIHANEGVPSDIKFTSAATNDSFMLRPSVLNKGDIIAMDRAYIDYEKLETLTQREVMYVTKMKKNLKYNIIEDCVYQNDKGFMEVRIQNVTFSKILKDGTVLIHHARIITYVDIKKHKLVSLLTNDMESDPNEIIEIYHKRWEIELLFKQIKQNFPLKYFYGESANAIKIQIWVTLIANLLLMVMKKELTRYSKALIPQERETIASMLKKNGYITAGIGKWHLGWDWNNIDNGNEYVDFSKPVKNGPTTRGFDYFYGFCGSLDMPPYIYIENDLPTSIPVKTTVNKGKYSWWRKGPTKADFVHEEVLPNITDRACKYIKEKSKLDKPYFLYIPLPSPHTPILPTKEFIGKSGLGEYGDYVIMTDAMVGKVLKAIDESGEGDNTIVVFTTDNGCSPAAGINELIEQGHYPNSIYRGHKADLFDGGHRVPCIMRWPNGAKPHYVNQTVCLTDFYATFADINEYKLKDSEGEDSYSLLSAIKSVKEVKTIREATVHHSIKGEFTIRKGKWKLLMSPSSGGWSYPRPGKDNEVIKILPEIQLYNMAIDPNESNNVYKENPKVVKELKEILIRYIKNGRSTPGKIQKNDGKEIWNQIKWINEI